MTKVLVFESDHAFAGELRTELGRLGCTVQVVDDGNAGLQLAANDRPDLILLSIELPRMNGFSVCNKLKKDPQLKDVPLVIMSSESTAETFEQHRKLRTRAEDYVHKPIAFGELLGHIRALVPIDATIEPDAIVIDDAEVIEADEVEEVEEENTPPNEAAGEREIDDFLGGAFDRLMADDDEEKTRAQVFPIVPPAPPAPAAPPPVPQPAPVAAVAPPPPAPPPVPAVAPP
ncbi:response regulator, partial [Polyangium sp. y55x31]|uniref:response regulator transcription factor n=1 Tax=Polyangium sp. y55x31 TaxID=3042688 RepID=UPI0024828C0F